MRPGGQILVDQLVVRGVDAAFGVPGESYLAVLEKQHDEQILLSLRHEGGAANMAEAYGKLTVARHLHGHAQAGATHAKRRRAHGLSGLDAADLIIGQVGREKSGREAFQEIDYRQMFGGMAKWVGQIEIYRPGDRFVNRALSCRQSGAPVQ